MKVHKKVISIILIMLLFSSCIGNGKDVNKLELYILRFDKTTKDYIMDEPPIFTNNDILSYEWATHTIIFTDEYLEAHKTNDKVNELMVGGSIILGVFYPDEYVIYLNEKELYSGIFMPPAYISFMPPGPMIANSERGIVINYIYGDDPRSNDELFEFLKENNLLSK